MANSTSSTTSPRDSTSCARPSVWLPRQSFRTPHGPSWKTPISRPPSTTLEEAHRVAPEAEGTDDLLAAAREGIRLQEEAQRRRMAIDEAALKIDRLVLAGRLESAIRLVDETVEELGDFDEAEELRRRIVSDIEKTTRTLEKVEQLIEAALTHSAEDRFSEANEALESARELASDIPDAIEIVVEGETEIHRRIDAHRRLVAIDKVVTSVDRQLDKGAVDEAQRELAVARRLYGASEVFDELDSKIDAKGRELRRLEIDRLVEKALEGDRPFDEVFADLESASALDPHNERVQRVLAQTEVGTAPTQGDARSRKRRRGIGAGRSSDRRR